MTPAIPALTPNRTIPASGNSSAWSGKPRFCIARSSVSTSPAACQERRGCEAQIAPKGPQ